MKIFFKSLGFLFGLLFVAGAIVQYNDPDPLVWMLVYGVAALLSISFALGKIGYKVLLGIALVCIAGFFYMYPETFEGFEIGKGDIKNIEEGREAFGLLIIGLVLGLFSFSAKRNA